MNLPHPDNRKDRFVAHVVITPDDGGDPYTVETEFTATSYPAAWEHVMGFGQKFGGRVTSHRLAMVGEKDTLTPPFVRASAASPLLLPAPAKEPTLTVNVEPVVPEFVSKYEVGMPATIPMPNDGVII